MHALDLGESGVEFRFEDHGTAHSLYLEDPDGNVIDISGGHIVLCLSGAADLVEEGGWVAARVPDLDRRATDEAPAAGRSILSTSRSSKGAKAYRGVAESLVTRSAR